MEKPAKSSLKRHFGSLPQILVAVATSMRSTPHPQRAAAACTTSMARSIAAPYLGALAFPSLF